MTEAVSIDERYGCAAADGVQRDVVAAMAFSAPLAALLKRAKYADDKTAHLPAALGLGDEVKRRAFRRRIHVTPQLARRIGTLVLVEWLHQRCPSCHGVGHVARDQALRNTRPIPRNAEVVVCRTCDGAGHASHGDASRRKAIGVDEAKYRRIAPLIAWVSLRLTVIDAQATDEARRQLRWAARPAQGAACDYNRRGGDDDGKRA